MAADAQSGQPKVSRVALRGVEQNFDESFSRIWSDDPFALLGNTRGIYLDGYGAVFTAEVNVAVGPPMSPMRTLPISETEKADHQKRKAARMPQLQDAMLKMLVKAASLLETLPPDQQIVLGVTIAQYNWEDPRAFPAQIVYQAPKSKLLGLRNASPAAIKAAISTQDFYAVTDAVHEPTYALSEILIERRQITSEDLERALELQKERGEKIGKILVDLGFIAMRDVLARPRGAIAGAAGRHRRLARRFSRNRDALAALSAPVPLPAHRAGGSPADVGHGRSAGL